jgi:hypothetical protein
LTDFDGCVPPSNIAGSNTDERLLDADFGDFAMELVLSFLGCVVLINTHRILPLYSGPEVKISIGSASHEYRLRRALLCRQSSYFAAMFEEGHFKEGEEQSTNLEEIDGVVTARSFKMLVQWVCLGWIVFGECEPDVAITTAIEFARLADMCGITCVESFVAERIKAIILANPGLETNFDRSPSTNTHHLTSQNITSAFNLPEGHPVRAILAAASIEDILGQDIFTFQEAASTVPGFSVALLKAVKGTIGSVHNEYGRTTFVDPLSQVNCSFRKT